MRRFLAALSAIILTFVSIPANAQDLTNGGRVAFGSSDLSRQLGGLSPQAPLPEFGGTVDLEKYSGLWYQVAAIPQPYSLQCAKNTTARYKVVAPGTVSVLNSCDTPWGQHSSINGTAKARSNGSLRVNFPGVPFQKENGPANYVVTYLADDYSLAIVGSPQRNSGFVLSRTPSLDTNQWKHVRRTLEQRGWWSCSFIAIPMFGHRANTYTPVCNF